METPIRAEDETTTVPVPHLRRLREVLEHGDESPVVREAAAWMHEHLTRPHPALGRTGAVCPWVEESSARGLCLITRVHRTADSAAVDRVVRALGAHYLAMGPQGGATAQLKAIVIVFDGLEPDEAPGYIDALHQRHKPAFVHSGMMLGEFYPSCRKPGLRNPDFRPLRSPVPLLVIRPMVRQDIVFLADRSELIRAYLRVHQQAGCQEILSTLAKGDGGMDRDTGLRLLDAVRECYRA